MLGFSEFVPVRVINMNCQEKKKKKNRNKIPVASQNKNLFLTYTESSMNVGVTLQIVTRAASVTGLCVLLPWWWTRGYQGLRKWRAEESFDIGRDWTRSLSLLPTVHWPGLNCIDSFSGWTDWDIPLNRGQRNESLGVLVASPKTQLNLECSCQFSIHQNTHRHAENIWDTSTCCRRS